MSSEKAYASQKSCVVNAPVPGPEWEFVDMPSTMYGHAAVPIAQPLPPFSGDSLSGYSSAFYGSAEISAASRYAFAKSMYAANVSGIAVTNAGQ